MNTVEQSFERFRHLPPRRPYGQEQEPLTDDASPAEPPPTFPAPVSARQLIADYPEMKPVIIDGVLRETETVNIVAGPKSHKTYLALSLALSIAIGRQWLGREVKSGRVLYIDCELHPETFAKRLAAGSSAMGITADALSAQLSVLSLRGRLIDIYSLGAFIRTLAKGEYACIVLDALYRLFPERFDENSNADMTALYNVIDGYAELTGAAFVVIHHASKGNHRGKAVTDVGSGAGSQSRAADSHLVFRPHEEDGCVVVEGAV